MGSVTLRTKYFEYSDLADILEQNINSYYKGRVYHKTMNFLSFSTGTFWTLSDTGKKAYKEKIRGTINIYPAENENTIKISYTRLKGYVPTFLVTFLLFIIVPILMLFDPYLTEGAIYVFLFLNVGFSLANVIYAHYVYNEAERLFTRYITNTMLYLDFLIAWKRPLRSANLGFLP